MSADSEILPLPRKFLLRVPQQKRSRITVDCILESAWELLREEGAEAVTTTAVAKRAEVNVAALYQYFLNREQIISALVERHLIIYENQLRAIAVQMYDQPLEDLLTAATNVTLEALLPMRAEISEIFSVIPLMGEYSVPAVIESIIMDLARNYLIHNSLRIEGGLPALYVAINAMTLTTMRWLIDPPPGLEDQQVRDALRSMVSKLIVVQ